MIITGRRDLIFDIEYFFGERDAGETVKLTTDFQQADSLTELVTLIRQHLGEVLVCTQHEQDIRQVLLKANLCCNRDYFFFSSLRNAFETKVKRLCNYTIQKDEMDLLWNVYDRIFHAAHNRYYPCHHPLYEAELAEDGQVYTCCSGIMPFSIGSLQSEPFHSIWHSPRARLVRLTTLNGTAIFCSPERCGQLRLCSGTYPVMQKQVSDDPLTVNIAVDATCNLFCVSCRTGYIKAGSDSIHMKCGWLKDLSGSFYQNVKDIYVAGNGECMVSAIYYYYLTEELPARFSGDLHLVTNGQTWNQSLIKVITDRFCPEVLISVDAWSRRTYEMLRRGGDHKKLMENIDKYLALRDIGKVSGVVLRFVVQRANYSEIPLFIDHMRQLGVNRMEFTRLVNGGSFTVGDFQNASLLTSDGTLRQEYLPFFMEKVWPRLSDDVVMDRAYLPVEMI